METVVYGRCIRFVVPGSVRGQGRPRTRIAYGKNGSPFAHIYETEEDRSYKGLIQFHLMKEAKRLGIDLPIEHNGRGVSVSVQVMRKVPRSWRRKNRALAEAGEYRPQTRPDLDNVIKIVLDAMNGVAYADDAEVTNITATRSFSIDGSESLIVGLYWEEEAEHENRAVGASKGSGCEIISDGEENASEARLDGNQG